MRPAPAQAPPASPGHWLRAAAAVAAATAATEVLHPWLDLADIIMVYLAGVAWVALREPLAVSVATVCASLFLFDLLYVPPRWGLNPINKSHWVTFAILLGVGFLISRLADQARRQRVEAQAQARRASALADLAGALAAAPTREAVAQAVEQAARKTFGLTATLLPAGSPPAQDARAWPLRGGSGTLAELRVEPGDPAPLGAEDSELLAAFAHQAAVALERCEFEEQVLAARVQAESERLRSTLLSGISHDFRTPLTTIVGAAATLLEQDERLDAGRRMLLARSIRDEASRLHGLVSDLLDVTRLEEGAVQLAPEWCPADDLLQEAAAALGARAASHRLELHAAPEAIVWCDPRLVEQALVNLLDNALRYTPAGTRVRAEIHAERPHWRLVVRDEGPGLPPGSEAAVFRKFHRGQAEPAGGGTGLGLAICAAVARLHGGAITARNEGGACFEMRLPQPGTPDAVSEEAA